MALFDSSLTKDIFGEGKAGLENRKQILPSQEPKGFDFLGPDYNYADEIFGPSAIGVKRGSSFDDVSKAISGMAYYMDTIAFGESSNPLSSRFKNQFKRYGVNYFLKTGAKCSNGADMYQYIETIPKGDAMGKNIAREVQAMGLTQMRGLAPGIIEDAKAAMNPAPLLGAMMGSGYPRCKLATKPVGDEFGFTRDADGKPWVEDPTTLVQCGKGQDGNWYTNGQKWQELDRNRPPPIGSPMRPCQTKWIVDKMVSKEVWDSDPKTLNPDGTPATQTTESFEDSGGNRVLVAVLGTLIVANIWALTHRR
jgi:hypothetical protein